MRVVCKDGGERGKRSIMREMSRDTQLSVPCVTWLHIDMESSVWLSGSAWIDAYFSGIWSALVLCALYSICPRSLRSRPITIIRRASRGSTHVDDSILEFCAKSKRVEAFGVLLTTIPYLEMLRLLLYYTFNCSRIHGGLYPRIAIERAVTKSARLALYEHRALLEPKAGAVILSVEVEVTHAESLSCRAFSSVFDEDIAHFLFRAQ